MRPILRSAADPERAPRTAGRFARVVGSVNWNEGGSVWPSTARDLERASLTAWVVWSARHRKLAIGGWLGFVIVSFALGTLIGTETIDPDTSGSGEAGRMWKIVATEFEQPVGEVPGWLDWLPHLEHGEKLPEAPVIVPT